MAATAARTITILLISAQLLCAFLAGTFLIREYPHAFDGSSPADFPNYYFPAKRLIEGRPLYDPLAPEVNAALGWEYSVYPADPPLAILLLSPLAFFPYFSAWHLLLVLSAILVSISMEMTASELGWNRLQSATAAFFGIAAAPTLFLFKRNHFEAVLLLMAVLGWKALRRGKFGAVLLCWSGAAALKLFPAAWILALARRYGAGQVKPAVRCIVLLTLGAALLAGFGNSIQFVTDIIPRSSQWYGAIGNYSIVSFGAAMGSAAMGWAGCIAAACFLLQKRFWRGSPDDVFTKCVSFSLVISPLSWMNYQVLLLPIVLILFNRVQQSTPALRAPFYICAVAIWTFPGFIETGSRLTNVLAGFIPLYAAIGLFFLSDAMRDCAGASSNLSDLESLPADS